MRTIKELLQVMLDNQQYFSSGLCGWSRELRQKRIITTEEYLIIRDFIKYHRPKGDITVYYWVVGLINPRIEWLEKHIKLQE